MKIPRLNMACSLGKIHPHLDVISFGSSMVTVVVDYSENTWYLPSITWWQKNVENNSHLTVHWLNDLLVYHAEFSIVVAISFCLGALIQHLGLFFLQAMERFQVVKLSEAVKLGSYRSVHTKFNSNQHQSLRSLINQFARYD